MDSVIVFDMDGVLAEVTESYREAIVQTVLEFAEEVGCSVAFQCCEHLNRALVVETEVDDIELGADRARRLEVGRVVGAHDYCVIAGLEKRRRGREQRRRRSRSDHEGLRET